MVGEHLVGKSLSPAVVLAPDDYVLRMRPSANPNPHVSFFNLPWLYLVGSRL